MNIWYRFGTYKHINSGDAKGGLFLEEFLKLNASKGFSDFYGSGGGT